MAAQKGTDAATSRMATRPAVADALARMSVYPSTSALAPDSRLSARKAGSSRPVSAAAIQERYE